MKQTYFKEPKYSKNYLIQSPKNLYEQYVNAFAFSEMVKSHNKTPNKKVLHQQAQDSWREVKKEDKENIQNRIFELLRTPIRSYPFTFYEPVGESQSESQKESQKRPLIPLENPPELFDNIQPSSNATAQKNRLILFKSLKLTCMNTTIYYEQHHHTNFVPNSSQVLKSWRKQY
ncbi:uncharacterized protein OCT59_007237 [Rhizophagus irregularis]|uniref:uncharacterized protein n=1 Tax=Rhizophagus irregularis TaxID=588596 RepID=UPI0033215288|nr:hypothetical protein OCT59_007237 [Rhizophagus irregularis]